MDVEVAADAPKGLISNTKIAIIGSGRKVMKLVDVLCLAIVRDATRGYKWL
jgi:hypothetical protein